MAGFTGRLPRSHCLARVEAGPLRPGSRGRGRMEGTEKGLFIWGGAGGRGLDKAASMMGAVTLGGGEEPRWD